MDGSKARWGTTTSSQNRAAPSWLGQYVVKPIDPTCSSPIFSIISVGGTGLEAMTFAL